MCLSVWIHPVGSPGYLQKEKEDVVRPLRVRLPGTSDPGHATGEADPEQARNTCFPFVQISRYLRPGGSPNSLAP
eukprot:1726382-Alexandrium_andersonii.AAC.1